MQNKRQVFTWPISLLIVVVSFLSVLVVLQQVQAAWVEPNYLPGATNPNTFVFNPLAENLELGGKNITGTGNIDINGSANFTAITVNNLPITGGGGASSADWAILNGALYYTTTTGNGNVGIGRNNPDQTLVVNGGIGFGASFTSDKKLYAPSDGDLEWRTNSTAGAHGFAVSSQGTKSVYLNTAGNSYFIGGNLGIGTVSPNKLLHLYSTSPNAELDIQSTSAAGSHWGIYHDGGTDQLRFWKSAGNNVLTLGANGRVGVGTTPDNSNMLRTTTATAGIVGLYGENSATDWSFLPNLNPNNVGVKGVANNTALGGVGVYGVGYHGVKGSGFYGIYGEATSADSGSAGVYGKQGTGHFAAYLEGDVSVTGNLTVNNTGKYLQITNGTGAPASGCTIGGHNGRLYVDITVASPKLYVCVDKSWRPISL